ncbi:hypothetical protein D3C86_1542060 [compost metagenome]
MLNLNCPLPSVITAVFVPLIFTEAPGKGLPLLSVITPLISYCEKSPVMRSAIDFVRSVITTVFS